MIEDQELRALFKTESEEHLQRLDEGLLRLETNPKDWATLEEVFREAHSLKGAAKMLGVIDVEMIAHRFEDVLGAAKRGGTVLSSETIERLYGGLDAIRKLVQEAVTGEPSGINALKVLVQLSGEGPATSPKETDEVTSGEDAFEASGSSGVPAPSAGAGSIVDRGSSETDSSDGQSPNSFPFETGPGRYRIETIRVEPQKLDALIAQAGELTVTKTQIAHRLSDIEEAVGLWEEWNRDAFVHRSALGGVSAGRSWGLERVTHNDEVVRRPIDFRERERERLERLGIILNRLRTGASKDNARLDLIAGKLEEGIRTVRLLPLSTIFNLFPRMVRDIAKEQTKEVQLVIEGGVTTAEKNILEEMKDPLMHMIRNAIDHGIELPEERERKGKSRIGTIHLRAYQTATNIVIEVMDDGRGLDIETIKRTSVKRKISSEEELAAMMPEQVQSLIFNYGFSTSSFVTDVSGRGVGLNVVRTNIERLKGTVQLESASGGGCTFRVQLPITLATARVLVATVNDQIYALPVEWVQTARLVSQQEIFS